MKKLFILLKTHWIKILVVILLAAVTIASAVFLYYCVANYWTLENFSRKQISGQMALLLPMFVIVQLITLPIMFAMQYYLMQGGPLTGIGREKMDKAKANVKWNEVIGMDEAKKEAWEMVKLLKDRSLLKVIGGKIVKGTLMIGPPGCGKTYLAKAIATECGLPMISAAGSEFVGIFIGVGASRIRSLFKQARAMAALDGGCIVFIDEIDSFARPRQMDRGFGGATDHNATVNQFLTELDGLRQAENNIVVIAATNVPEDELDSAITRAGRFDRKIYFSKPNLQERQDLFKFYLSRVKTDSSIDVNLLARKALYFSPSDIDSMIREAGLIALRSKRDVLSMKDLSEAYDRVTFGMKSNINLTKEEKVWTAYHEAGHAVIAYLIHPTNDVIKATIIPHKGALGFVSQRPVEELHSSNREHLLANIKVSIASYVAELLQFGTTSSGVGGGQGSDFSNAMRLAHSMVWRFGMGKSGLVGDFFSMVDNSGQPIISEKIKETLDGDVQDILQTCIKEVRAVLVDKRDLLECFAQELLKKEELEYDDIVAIFDKFGLKSAARPITSVSAATDKAV